MPEQKKATPGLADFIEDKLDGDVKQSLLDFIAYCKANQMPIRLSSGYLWGVFYKGKRVATIEITTKGYRRGQHVYDDDAWMVSVSYLNYNTIESPKLDQFIKEENLTETVRKNVAYCKGCLKACIGAQEPGLERKIAGEVFRKVCVCCQSFKNPDAEAMDCVKKLMEFRKNVILCENTNKA